MIEAKLCNPLLPEQLERQFASLAARLETVDRRVTAALADEDMRTVLQGAAPLFHPALTPEGMRGGRSAGGRGSESGRRAGGSVRSNSTSGRSAITSSSSSSSSSSGGSISGSGIGSGRAISGDGDTISALDAPPETLSATADAAAPALAAVAARVGGADVTGEACDAVIASAGPGSAGDTVTAPESTTDDGSPKGAPADVDRT